MPISGTQTAATRSDGWPTSTRETVIRDRDGTRPAADISNTSELIDVESEMNVETVSPNW